jgi:protein-S-isoprenylcysteine O-methyltransferase Ste14
MIQIILIFCAFAFIHSITVSKKFKHACRDFFGETFMRVYYRALYNAVSLITALSAFHFIHHVPDYPVWNAPRWLALLMYGMQLAGLIFGALSFRYLNGMEFLGLEQVRRYLARREISGNIEGLTQKDLVTTGVYGIVRHPMYLAGIIIFTFNPQITVNSITVTVLADFYFMFGMLIEDRRFLQIFGEDYREYMKRVPRVLPKIIH